MVGFWQAGIAGSDLSRRLAGTHQARWAQKSKNAPRPLVPATSRGTVFATALAGAVLWKLAMIRGLDTKALFLKMPAQAVYKHGAHD